MVDRVEEVVGGVGGRRGARLDDRAARFPVGLGQERRRRARAGRGRRGEQRVDLRRLRRPARNQRKQDAAGEAGRAGRGKRRKRVATRPSEGAEGDDTGARRRVRDPGWPRVEQEDRPSRQECALGGGAIRAPHLLRDRAWADQDRAGREPRRRRAPRLRVGRTDRHARLRPLPREPARERIEQRGASLRLDAVGKEAARDPAASDVLLAGARLRMRRGLEDDHRRLRAPARSGARRLRRTRAIARGP
jgi:hypothetical protein